MLAYSSLATYDTSLPRKDLLSSPIGRDRDDQRRPEDDKLRASVIRTFLLWKHFTPVGFMARADRLVVILRSLSIPKRPQHLHSKPLLLSIYPTICPLRSPNPVYLLRSRKTFLFLFLLIAIMI
ncbi:unnamed protein product [Nezara viridula]|uniref:Uncharacterized protein n=1 Tax=Nezara viridula TaxID=85310 RepID=A0A9P0E7D9_NEZVI|nr:unnamed protein product [Nezara viridula]